MAVRAAAIFCDHLKPSSSSQHLICLMAFVKGLVKHGKTAIDKLKTTIAFVDSTMTIGHSINYVATDC